MLAFRQFSISESLSQEDSFVAKKGEEFTSIDIIFVTMNYFFTSFLEANKADSMATFWAQIQHYLHWCRNIVSELTFFKNQITNYPSLASRRESSQSFEGLNIEKITPLRSLEDQYGTISGLLSLGRTSVETAPPIPTFQ